MDQAERERLREAAETILHENPPVMAVHAVEVVALLAALEAAEAERDAARAEAKRLREALEWYGDPEHWESVRYYGDEDTVPGSWEDDPGSPEDDNCDPIFPRWVPDCGTRARAALAAATSEDA